MPVGVAQGQGEGLRTPQWLCKLHCRRVVVLAEVAKAPGCKWAAEDTHLAYTHSAGAKHGSHDVPSAEPAPARSWPGKVHLQVRVQVDLAGQTVDTHTSQSDRSKKE